MIILFITLACLQNCDSPYLNGTAWELERPPAGTANGGVAPSTGRWHHIAVTYSGAIGTPAYRVTIYLDGVVSNVADNRVPVIARTVPLAVGSWTPNNVASNAAIARLRVHDGVLTASQVAFNYQNEAVYLGLVQTPSATGSVPPTATPTPTRSNTQSVTATPTSSRSTTPSSSVTGTTTGSPSQTPTKSATGSSSQTGSTTGTQTISPSRTATNSRTPVSSLTSTRSNT